MLIKPGFFLCFFWGNLASRFSGWCTDLEGLLRRSKKIEPEGAPDFSAISWFFHPIVGRPLKKTTRRGVSRFSIHFIISPKLAPTLLKAFPNSVGLFGFNWSQGGKRGVSSKPPRNSGSSLWKIDRRTHVSI